MPKPPAQRAASTPWPMWPLQLRTEAAHEEGGIRDWSINSVEFTGDARARQTVARGARRPSAEVRTHPGSEFTLDVDLVLLAMGFLARALGND